uniref:Uncharacterized protein n=1 Tax=Arundo donax TaxID=35708 RepID=A0A0A8YVT7_ARUDO
MTAAGDKRKRSIPTETDRGRRGRNRSRREE